MEEPVNVVKDTICVVGGEDLLVCPLIADVAHLADDRPFGRAEVALKDALPLADHHAQKSRRVPLSRFEKRSVAESEHGLLFPFSRSVDGFHLALHIREKSAIQEIERLFNALTIC